MVNATGYLIHDLAIVQWFFFVGSLPYSQFEKNVCAQYLKQKKNKTENNINHNEESNEWRKSKTQKMKEEEKTKRSNKNEK